MTHAVFPFAAIVGQEPMKLALLLNAVDPLIGGVLIRGEKGTAKSTAARGLAGLLPPSRENGTMRETPFITLPLNATEDMVAGGIDLERTIARGAAVVQPGILSRVDGGVLYIDEVNLLDDHLVDIILDAAASGLNRIEREGVSYSHPCRFTLVGTMNPEEGALRPQLLDRFGLCVEVKSEQDADKRVGLMEAREEFERDPERFCQRFAAEGARCTGRLRQAQKALPAVRLSQPIRKYIADLTLSQRVAGHRADLVIARAACALAAWLGRTTVTVRDVTQVAEMALLHRRRDQLTPPPPPPPPQEQELEQQNPSERQSPLESQRDQTPQAPDEGPGGADSGQTDENPQGQQDDTVFDAGGPFRVRKMTPPKDRLERRGSGRRTRSRTQQRSGRYVRSRVTDDATDLALDATLRAAAPFQGARRATFSDPLVIHTQDWRAKVREKRTGTLILFVVDASRSMGARGRMLASKGAVLSLLLDAYQKRDRVGMITFRRSGADVALPVTSSIEVAAKMLRELPVGGRTPLAAGLARAAEVLAPEMRRERTLRPIAVVVTDGKANVALNGGNPLDDALAIARRLGADERIHWIVVDTEDPAGLRFQLAGQLAQALQAECFSIDRLRADDLVQIVKEIRA